jgi:hypothetical protein
LAFPHSAFRISTAPRQVILVNERKALKQCHVSCNMKSIMSHLAESTEQAVRKHLFSITLAQLVRKVRRVQRARPQSPRLFRCPLANAFGARTRDNDDLVFYSLYEVFPSSL